ETHQGLFDLAMLSIIPNIEIFSPSNDAELISSFYKAIYKCRGIAAIRYPKGEAVLSDRTEADYDIRYFKFEKKYKKQMIITYGRITEFAIAAAKQKEIDLLQLVKIYPIVEKSVESAEKYDKIIFFEEGIMSGGIGEKFAFELMKRGWKGDYKTVAVENRFVSYGETDSQLAKYKLDTNGMIEEIGDFFEQT
ncbi:MAG: 1-deoxy-D-xylulose-5-phosphate synthase, partial [Ruminiclostridium sp.]|nr:1-deoxy-D-xylulose-5-phosphate synthase [Ruminiclostridium sp.]